MCIHRLTHLLKVHNQNRLTHKALEDFKKKLALEKQFDKRHPTSVGTGHFKRDSLLYRRCILPRQLAKGSEATKVDVISKTFREEVLKLAHNITLAGHIRKEKTAKQLNVAKFE